MTDTALVKLDMSKRTLATITDVQEIKQYISIITAVQQVREDAGAELAEINEHVEKRIRLMHRGGELLAGMDLAQGRRTDLLAQGEEVVGRPSLRELGLTWSQSSRWQMIWRLPEKLFEETLKDFIKTEDKLTARAFYALARRNLSPDQRKEALKRMKATAKALKKEGNTQARIAAMLGVARNTVSVWLMPNVKDDKRHTDAFPDSRVKIPPKQRPTILKRIGAGESQAQIAADYAVNQSQISRIVKAEKKQQAIKVEREATVAKLGGDLLDIHHGDFRPGESLRGAAQGHAEAG